MGKVFFFSAQFWVSEGTFGDVNCGIVLKPFHMRCLSIKNNSKKFTRSRKTGLNNFGFHAKLDNLIMKTHERLNSKLILIQF